MRCGCVAALNIRPRCRTRTFARFVHEVARDSDILLRFRGSSHLPSREDRPRPRRIGHSSAPERSWLPVRASTVSRGASWANRGVSSRPILLSACQIGGHASARSLRPAASGDHATNRARTYELHPIRSNPLLVRTSSLRCQTRGRRLCARTPCIGLWQLASSRLVCPQPRRSHAICAQLKGVGQVLPHCGWRSFSVSRHRVSESRIPRPPVAAIPSCVLP